MYFDKFPQILYDFSIGNEPTKNYLVTDIIRRVKLSNVDIKKFGAFDPYTILEGDTPEIVSMKYYGVPYYHWLILMINDLYYGLTSFPLSQYDLETYLTDTYGITEKYAVHHYEDSDGNEVNNIQSGNNLKIFNPVSLQWDLFPISNYTAITNYAYEELLNENKRYIYLLKPAFVNDVVKEINRLLAA